MWCARAAAVLGGNTDLACGVAALGCARWSLDGLRELVDGFSFFVFLFN